MVSFQYHPEILTRFPTIVGGVLIVHNLENCQTPEDLQGIYQAEQENVKTSIGNKPLSEVGTLVAWRAAFRSFGVNPTKYRSASEALLRRLTKKGDIPSINAVVDICNLVSIRYRLPVAAFDTRELTGPITVQIANGSENFTPLFQDVPEHPDVGEVIFADDKKLVVARRWCWRQSNESATQLDTTSAVFTVEGHHETAGKDIQNAVNDLHTLLTNFVGGDYTTGILDVNNPRI